MKRDLSEEDWEHYKDMGREHALSKAEEYIYQMTMDDVWEFFGDLDGKHQSELMEAIRLQDDMEVGSVFMEALRQHAKDATT